MAKRLALSCTQIIHYNVYLRVNSTPVDDGASMLLKLANTFQVNFSINCVIYKLEENLLLKESLNLPLDEKE